MPDLKRDAFETVKEFQKRISDCKPVLAGQADLLKDKYDINTGVFPVKISWKEWAEPFVNKSKEVHIIAERDLASSIYESGREHPVYTLWGADSEKPVINRIDLYAINQPFKIETIFYKKPKYPCRSKPFDSVLDKEARTRFNLDNNWRPKKYVPNEFELIKNDTVVADHSTGLMWQREGSEIPMKYHDALMYVKHINSNKYASFNDWRLPTIHELATLVTEDKQTNKHYIDSIFIFNSRHSSHWSTDKRKASVAYRINFKRGDIFWNSLFRIGWVRAVRAGQ